MKRLAVILSILWVPVIAFAEVPTVDLPTQCREQNWVDPITHEGSCVFATQVTALRWFLEDDEATYWRDNFAGGEYADDTWQYGNNLARKLDARQLHYVYSLDGDPAILDWAMSTRRPVGVTTHGGRHMQLLVHFDDEWAALIDSNNPGVVNWIERDRFLAEWRASNQWAVVLIESPAPPLPKRKET